MPESDYLHPWIPDRKGWQPGMWKAQPRSEPRLPCCESVQHLNLPLDVDQGILEESQRSFFTEGSNVNTMPNSIYSTKEKKCLFVGSLAHRRKI